MSEAPDQAAAEPIEEQPAAPASARAGERIWPWVLLLTALLIAGAFALARLERLQKEVRSLQQRGSEVTAQQGDAAGELKVLQQRLDASTQRADQLEQQLAVLSGRAGGADTELRRLREEHVLIEVDELLTLAGSQLQIARDPSAALAALTSADARLALVPRPQFFALREALARDIERLRRVPMVDAIGVSIRLDRLVQGIDSWHLLADPTRHLAPPPPRSVSDVVPLNRLGWFGREIGDALRDLVRIRTVEAPDALLLPAYQYQLVREQLRVRLLTARQALLAHNQALFQSDLADARLLIDRYFDTSDPLVASALTQMKALETATVDAALPTLDDSAAALRAARRVTP